jgi:hypothetical protein
MMGHTLEILGMIGIGLSVVAYLPQVGHLAREHCSAGVSTSAWAMWLASSVPTGMLAVYRADYVFITLTMSNLLSSLIILLLARRYKGMTCATHAHLAPSGASR